MTEESLFLYHSTTPNKNQMVMKNMDLDLCLNLMRGIEVSEKDLQGCNDENMQMIIPIHIMRSLSLRYLRGSLLEIQLWRGELWMLLTRLTKLTIIYLPLDTYLRILNENSNLLFVLMLYRLVDIILSGDLHNAIKFAKGELSSCIKKDKKPCHYLPFKILTYDLFTLLQLIILFGECISPEALEIIKKIQKPDEISTLVDNSLIAYYNLDPKPILENIIKETLWVESQLESKVY
uniref:CTLH/CRA C-terminal to LisH motif domain containing protein, putative n=1 Tax=Theileria annulata TaxID=5874 RepID=A0A3B0MWJ0_THEAN